VTTQKVLGQMLRPYREQATFGKFFFRNHLKEVVREFGEFLPSVCGLFRTTVFPTKSPAGVNRQGRRL
jgi:hypothetical protein